jgi:hypothetical protein
VGDRLAAGKCLLDENVYTNAREVGGGAPIDQNWKTESSREGYLYTKSGIVQCWVLRRVSWAGDAVEVRNSTEDIAK